MMSDFTTTVYLVASGNDLSNDLPYLQKIIEIIYKNHALLTRDWIGAAIARKKRTPDIENADWRAIVDESLEAIKRSDLVIAEISLSDFNQGIQTYIAAQYKKPTLALTRGQVEGQFISGLENTNKYLTVKHYTTANELEQIVTSFIVQHSIPTKDLRFNLFLDRRIFKYLREKSYETGKNKSEIIRELLEREIERREN
jgi:hypothetical protein